MAMIAMAYIVLTFFEPAHLHSDEFLLQEAPKVNWTVFKVELTFMCFLFLECILRLILLFSSFKYISAAKHKHLRFYKRLGITLFKENLASFLAILLQLAFVIDFIFYYHYFPYGILHVTRLLRPRRLHSPSATDGLHDQAQEDRPKLHSRYSQSSSA